MHALLLELVWFLLWFAHALHIDRGFRTEQHASSHARWMQLESLVLGTVHPALHKVTAPEQHMPL